MCRRRRFIQRLQRRFVRVLAEQHRLDGGEHAADGAEGVIDGGRFIATVYHAVGALWIAALGAVFVPCGGVDEFLEGVNVAVLQ